MFESDFNGIVTHARLEPPPFDSERWTLWVRRWNQKTGRSGPEQIDCVDCDPLRLIRIMNAYRSDMNFIAEK